MFLSSVLSSLLTVFLSQVVNINVPNVHLCIFFPIYICLSSGSLFLFCETKQSSLKKMSADEECETDAESKTMLVSFLM